MTSVFNQKISIGVMGLPLNKQGQFLVTLRNEPKYQAAHLKWQTTGGGMRWGETPEQTLSRELKEELDVIPKILYPHPIAKSHVWHFHDRDSHVLLLCYVVDIGSQKPRVDGKENLDLKWIYPDEIKDLNFLPLCDDFIRESWEIVKLHNLLKALS